jgi:ABC-type multidrug transport system fused ATPase/permease subunit
VFEEPPGRALARLASSASKQMGLVARSLVQLVLPLAQLVVGVGTMLWLDPLLTLLLLPLVLLYLLPLSRVNRGVAADQRELGGVARQAHGLVADGVGAALDGDVAPGGAAVWADELAGAALRRHGTLLFYRRRLADNLMQFVNTIAFVVGLLAVLVYHVLVVGDGTHTWTSLLLYLAAVKLAQGAVRHMTGLIVRISRLTPEFAPYLEFVRRAEALAAGAASSDRLPAWPGPRLRTGAPLRPSDDDDFEFEE